METAIGRNDKTIQIVSKVKLFGMSLNNPAESINLSDSWKFTIWSSK